MLKDLYESGKLYGYITDYYSGGKGIVIADNEEEAKQKVKVSYLKHGYSESELEEYTISSDFDFLFGKLNDSEYSYAFAIEGINGATSYSNLVEYEKN